MKHNLLFLSIFLLLFTFNISTAQNNQLTLLENDLIKVAENFAAPGAEGAALQASAGWFTSASTLDKWKFEVSIHGNALFVPSGKQKNYPITGILI